MEEINKEIGLDTLLRGAGHGSTGHETPEEKEKKEVEHGEGEIREKEE
jgi:hypothetical protein